MTKDDVQQISIGPDILDRWQLVAEDLGEHGAGLRLELDIMKAGDCSRDRLERAGKAARLAEKSANGELRILAGALADEIKQASAR